MGKGLTIQWLLLCTKAISEPTFSFTMKMCNGIIPGNLPIATLVQQVNDTQTSSFL